MNYLLNDDMTINAILNGSYTGTPAGHSVYLSYPLSGLLSLLYRILPVIPWFALLLLGCYVFGAAAVLITVWKRMGKRLSWANVGSMALAIGMIVFLLVPQAVEIHYTVCAATLCMGAIFLAALGEGVWLPAISFALGYCVRRDVFLLAIPFLGVTLLWRMLREKGQWKKAVLLGVSTMVLAGAFMGIHGICYHDKAWQDYNAYNDARTDLYDYTWYKQYEEIPAVYEEYGVTYEQYQVVDHYALGLAHELDVPFLEAMRDASVSVDWQDTTMHTLKRMLVKYRDWILKEKSEPFSYVAILFYLLLLMLLWRQGQYLKSLLVLAMGAGRSAIWVFLFWRGRFPERVMMSLFIIELFLLLAMLLDTLWQMAANTEKTASNFQKRLARSQSGWLVLFAFVLFVSGCLLSGQSAEKQKEQATLQEEYQVAADYFESHPENTYILDVRTMGVYTAGFFSREMMQPNTLLAGGWLTRSPLMDERYASLGVLDGGEALAICADTYYVTTNADDATWLQSYLQTRYPDCSVSVTDSLKLETKTIYILGVN